MKFSVVVLLSCMLVPEVLSLTCQQCSSTIDKPCPSTPINCSDVCGSVTFSSYISSTNTTIVITEQNCTASNTCVNGSVNYGSSSTSINTQCCSTDFCNNQTLPVPPQQQPNGLSCYTCNNTDCSIKGTLNCSGDQNFCISVNAVVGSSTSALAGCSTKSICDAGSLITQLTGGISVNCCQGNLCNNAESFTLNSLSMIIFLLCSIILY